MEELLNNCPLCSSGQFSFISEIEDHALSKEKFSLYQCKNCSLTFTNPRPKIQSSHSYYAFKNYASHQKTLASFQDLIYHEIRKVNLRGKLKLINRLRPEKGFLLDYGTGTGYFPREAKKDGWSVSAIEPNENAIENGVFSTTFSDLSKLPKEAKFDIITLFHVLEHVHALKETLHHLKSLLNSEGYLILALPNCESYDAKMYGNHWAAYDVPRHLYHFNPTSTLHLASLYGYEIVQKLPMIYDSYYVSLLSEKYKNPHLPFPLQWIKAILNGFLSNHKAKLKGQNYSSILYILKKK
jgi:SAM-dependent methyltransferase